MNLYCNVLFYKLGLFLIDNNTENGIEENSGIKYFTSKESYDYG